jgi:four helix bundle protein
LNYGEVRGAESRKDFIHKNQVVLKELRETYNALRILHRSGCYKQADILENIRKECNELVSIFVKTVQSAKKRKA